MVKRRPRKQKDSPLQASGVQESPASDAGNNPDSVALPSSPANSSTHEVNTSSESLMLETPLGAGASTRLGNTQEEHTPFYGFEPLEDIKADFSRLQCEVEEYGSRFREIPDWRLKFQDKYEELAQQLDILIIRTGRCAHPRSQIQTYQLRHLLSSHRDLLQKRVNTILNHPSIVAAEMRDISHQQQVPVDDLSYRSLFANIVEGEHRRNSIAAETNITETTV